MVYSNCLNQTINKKEVKMKIPNSPFKKYEKSVLKKDNDFALILRKAVLSMFDGEIHKFGLSTIGFLDDYYEEIFKYTGSSGYQDNIFFSQNLSSGT